MEAEAFRYDEDIHKMKTIETLNEFFRFLRVKSSLLSKTLTATAFNNEFTFDNFVEAANAMAKSIKDERGSLHPLYFAFLANPTLNPILDFANGDLLVFKSTGGNPHRGYVVDTQCKPDYTAAFESHWGCVNTTLWPCIRLVGGAASKGKTRDHQEKQATSYLHYLLLARPDLHVAQGLLTSDTEVTFLFGIGGLGIHTYTVPWGTKTFNGLMCAFIYRLYDPGHFADSSYVKMDPNLEKNFVTYTVQIAERTKVNDVEEITCPDLLPICASNPFSARTHILSNPDSEVRINGKPLTVLKDQLCQVGAPFDEYSILTQIHNPETVPGVVEAVYHALIEVTPCGSVKKHRIGLRQSGKTFTTFSSLQQMLEIAFDTLEVLRYLRFERSILHRDISKGNVLYFEDNHISSAGLDAQSDGVNKAMRPKEVPLCFVKYLLGESNDPRKTSALLIDFNHAEDLRPGRKQGAEHERTGTPVFVARAVELGHPMAPPPRAFVIPAMSESPVPYTSNHPDRIERFPVHASITMEPSKEPMNCKWRHELDHDAESVFWLLVYWAVSAQPEECQEESINRGIWSELIGSTSSRNRLVWGGFGDATHSAYKPLWPLLESVACFLSIDRHWVESSDPRNDPGYLNEAFQRLILQFILDNRGEEFMKYKVARSPRRPEPTPENTSLSWAAGWIIHSENSRKRPSPSPSIPRGRMKRPRINATADETDT